MTDHEGGYIVEFHQVGNSVKVTAFDPSTLMEATVIGPTNATQEQLSQLAIRKLHYLLNKEQP